ncbi:hypothetical protein BBJ28_00014439 [Nothophytophthora sp. Chile5]|nr:hypothetical protein BBJ28_00014439 [Nothophytophthora sp. Chile5]
MLGFQYVVAKSRELSSKLDRELSLTSSSTPPPAPQPTERAPSSAGSAGPSSVVSAALSPRNEGHAFLRAQQQQNDRVLSAHDKLMSSFPWLGPSGDELATSLASARATLQAQAASEQFLVQNFHLVSRVRQQLTGVRALVLKLAEDAEDVENLLAQRCEESAARQNAEFAARQQQELERFEERIARESQGRKRELLELRRQTLAKAFQSDLKTYQALVAHHGDAAATEAATAGPSGQGETLDSIDLVVAADADQLAAFYDSGSEEETTEAAPKFAPPPTAEEEEEKSEETEEEVPQADHEDHHEEGGDAEEVASEATKATADSEDKAGEAAGAGASGGQQ